MTKYLPVILHALLCGILSSTASVHATQMSRCINASGKTIYTDQGCAASNINSDTLYQVKPGRGAPDVARPNINRTELKASETVVDPLMTRLAQKSIGEERRCQFLLGRATELNERISQNNGVKLSDVVADRERIQAIQAEYSMRCK